MSFDFSAFLIAAERDRRLRGLSLLYIVVVPKEDFDGHHDGKLVDDHHIDWRLHNIILPLTQLLPSCSGFTVCDTRALAISLLQQNAEEIYPESYSVEGPISRHHTGWTVLPGHLGDDIQYFEAPDQAKKYAQKWIDEHAGGKPCVTLTLREAPFIKSRNSDPAVWGEFARRLTQKGFFPILLRDIDTALEVPPPELEAITPFSDGVFNLPLRIALYELCHINTFVANGPAQVCFYNKNVHFLYNLTGDWLDRKPSTFGRMGINDGEMPPFLHTYQRWIWRHQSADVLMAEFERLDTDLRQGQTDGTYEENLNPVEDHKVPILEYADRIYAWAQRTFGTSPEEIELAEAALDMVPDASLGSKGEMQRLINLSLGTKQLEKSASLLMAYGDKYGHTEENLMQLGVIFEAMNEFGKAVEFYEQAASVGDVSPQVLYRLGVSHRNLENYEVARDYFQILVDKGATYPDLLFELGQAYEGLEENESALEYYTLAKSKGLESEDLEQRKNALESGIG